MGLIVWCLCCTGSSGATAVWRRGRPSTRLAAGRHATTRMATETFAVCASLHPFVSCRTESPSDCGWPSTFQLRSCSCTLYRECRQTSASNRGPQLIAGSEAGHRAVHRPQQPAHPAAAAAQARPPNIQLPIFGLGGAACTSSETTMSSVHASDGACSCPFG